MTFSIIIVTHNPRRDVLRRVCDAIHHQSYDPAGCELVIVDNASAPAVTADEVGGTLTRLKLLREEKLGIVPARLAGIAAASGDAIVFVDDDNVIDREYVACAAALLRQHPRVGAAGGPIVGEFECAVPEWAQGVKHFLALRDFGPDLIISDWHRSARRDYPWCSPFGAGMVIRTECARHYARHVQTSPRVSLSRVGNRSLAGCDDAELVLKGTLEPGFETAYAPGLRLIHCIPPRRVQFSYLSRLAFQSGVSWGDFSVRYGFQSPVPRWSLGLRIARSFFREHAWERAGWVKWRYRAGEFVGRGATAVTSDNKAA